MLHAEAGPQEAVNMIGRWHDDILQDFLDTYAKLPSWGGKVDRQVHQYVEGLAQWVRGADDWSFEGPRYFGNRGLEVQRTREIYWLPLVEAGLSQFGETCPEIDADKDSIAALQIHKGSANLRPQDE